MAAKVFLIREFRPAEYALVLSILIIFAISNILLSRVPQEMIIKVSSGAESFCTYVAPIRLLIVMNSKVDFHVPQLSEPAIALRALVSLHFLMCVDEVLFNVLLPSKSLVTLVAGILLACAQ